MLTAVTERDKEVESVRRAASAASLALTPLLRAVLRSTPERQVVYQQGPIEFSQQPPDVGTMVSLVF